MTRRHTRRIEFTVPEELGERYDEARGLIPMATWIKANLNGGSCLTRDEADAILEALDAGLIDEGGEDARTAIAKLRSSADAKRAVRPIPKAGKS